MKFGMVGRDSGSLKLLFGTGELRQKPIKYWANTGRIPKYSSLKNIENAIKKMVGIRYSNGTCHLTPYAGGRLSFPFHVHWMGDCFEFTLYGIFGDGRPRLHFSRKVTSQSEFFTDSEIKSIQNWMEYEHHFIEHLVKLGREHSENDGKHSTAHQHVRKIRGLLNK